MISILRSMAILILMTKLFIALIIIILTAACSTTPKLMLNGVNKSLTPETVLEEFPTYQFNKVIWGGLIVNSQNLVKGSLLEILTYPLDSKHKPNTQEKPLGRFLIQHPDYLETMNYTTGRHITVIGLLFEVRKGFINEAQYLYPVVNAEQLHLWPTNDPQSDTQFYFGVDVGFTIMK